MKAVILAGGLGTRLTEETSLKPKPMVEIGGMPILWHIMKSYSHFGINDFIVCCGYKGYIIKEYFANYFLHMSDVTFNMKNNQMHVHEQYVEPWKVTLVDTGQHTLTGGRLKRVSQYLDHESPFCFTYGDGVSDINIAKAIEFHNAHGLKATITAVRPPGRYGTLECDGKLVKSFVEKPRDKANLINGGFFILNPSVLELIEGDHTSFENEPLQALTETGQLAAYYHDGFWQPMDTLRDKNTLNDLWTNKKAPWRLWDG